MSIYNLIMISEEELQSAEQGIDFRSLPAASGVPGLSGVSVEMLRMMHYHPQQKIFQIYKFIFSFNSVISSFTIELNFSPVSSDIV